VTSLGNEPLLEIMQGNKLNLFFALFSETLELEVE
jgi:hypothetical protein